MTQETHVKTRKSLIIKCMYWGHHVYKFSCSSATYFMSYEHFCNTLFLFSVSINRFAHFGLKELIWKFKLLTRLVQKTLYFWANLWIFSRFVVWPNSGYFWGVYKSHYCASAGVLFSFVYIMYLNIYSYLHGNQIKSKLGNTLYLWMIFMCVHLNLRNLSEGRTMIFGITFQYSIKLGLAMDHWWGFKLNTRNEHMVHFVYSIFPYMYVFRVFVYVLFLVRV